VFQTIFFYVFAAVLIGSALGVIASRNPVHSALFLVLAFTTSAFLWMLLEAEFLAIVLVLVYVGAVMVLFLFVVMMLDVNVESVRSGFTRYAPLGFGVMVAVIVMLGLLAWQETQDLNFLATPEPAPASYDNTAELGSVLYTQYIYQFELAAIILLVAIVAAIALTHRRRAGLKQQNVSRQVAVKAADRIRVVKMPSEGSE
jgi:NADH-quinone oxidoreductase subunit J